VEFVETTPAVSRLAHVRLVTFLGLLLLIDQLFIQHAVNTTMTKGPSVLLYFGFEYVILASTTASTIVKYAMFAADMAVDGRWESKGLYVFYLELVTDLLHIFVYLVFFLIIMKYYGFPLHLVRHIYEGLINETSRHAACGGQPSGRRRSRFFESAVVSFSLCFVAPGTHPDGAVTMGWGVCCDM